MQRKIVVSIKIILLRNFCDETNSHLYFDLKILNLNFSCFECKKNLKTKQKRLIDQNLNFVSIFVDFKKREIFF